MVIEYNLVKYRDLCFARPENLAKIHRLVGTRLVKRKRGIRDIVYTINHLLAKLYINN